GIPPRTSPTPHGHRRTDPETPRLAEPPGGQRRIRARRAGRRREAWRRATRRDRPRRRLVEAAPPRRRRRLTTAGPHLAGPGRRTTAVPDPHPIQRMRLLSAFLVRRAPGPGPAGTGA